MLAGPAGSSVKMRNKRHRNNFIEINGLFKDGKELIFIVVKFILATGKNICQRKLFVWYHIGTTPLLVDMVNCYWTSQFYHKSVRSCFILSKKESRIYAGSGVSQTPMKSNIERSCGFMNPLFEQMGGTYRREGDFLIPNLVLPDTGDYQIGKYGRMRRRYLKEHRRVLYTNLLTSGNLRCHLAEIDQACNERIESIVSAIAEQEGVTEALKAADQVEWVRRMNSIRNRAEEIVLTELVYA